MARTRQTTAASTGTVPAKIKQPHGGALNAGGTFGNKGGRPRNAVRDEALSIVARNLPALETLMQTAARDADRIGAFNAIAKLLPQQMEDVTIVRSVEERRAAVLAMLKRTSSA